MDGQIANIKEREGRCVNKRFGIGAIIIGPIKVNHWVMNKGFVSGSITNSPNESQQNIYICYRTYYNLFNIYNAFYTLFIPLTSFFVNHTSWAIYNNFFAEQRLSQIQPVRLHQKQYFRHRRRHSSHMFYCLSFFVLGVVSFKWPRKVEWHFRLNSVQPQNAVYVRLTELEHIQRRLEFDQTLYSICNPTNILRLVV